MENWGLILFRYNQLIYINNKCYYKSNWIEL
jgi:aminopeptidase N